MGLAERGDGVVWHSDNVVLGANKSARSKSNGSAPAARRASHGRYNCPAPIRQQLAYVSLWRIVLKKSASWLSASAQRSGVQVSVPVQMGIGAGVGINFASFRRF